MKKRTPLEKLERTLKTLGYSLISLPDRSQNIGLACFWGKIEHRSGRILGIMILISGAAEYIRHRTSVSFWLILTCFVLWATYLIAHTTEKKFYVKNFRSSTIGGK
jgi:hypothetical protein